MHTALTGGFTYHSNHLTGDSAQIAQGDNFLSIVVPEIEASQAYQNNGLILIGSTRPKGAIPRTTRYPSLPFHHWLRGTPTKAR